MQGTFALVFLSVTMELSTTPCQVTQRSWVCACGFLLIVSTRSNTLHRDVRDKSVNYIDKLSCRRDDLEYTRIQNIDDAKRVRTGSRCQIQAYVFMYSLLHSFNVKELMDYIFYRLNDTCIRRDSVPIVRLAHGCTYLTLRGDSSVVVDAILCIFLIWRSTDWFNIIIKNKIVEWSDVHGQVQDCHQSIFHFSWIWFSSFAISSYSIQMNFSQC